MSAGPAAAGTGGAAVFALLRSILRLHRQRLPPPMRAMGDTYVVSEFRRHLRSKTTEEQWRTFAVEWQRYTAMLGGTADQQAAFAAAQQQQPDASSGCCSGSSGGSSTADAAAENPAQANVASITAAIASGSADMTEQLLAHMSPDQRQQLIKLQQEALALGSEMLGKASLLAAPEGEPGAKA